ncbi:MAG: DUF2768 family protein [Candidatus Carbobacillus altaicus]|uniref:Uncharacterized protein n=1 Tax=Candidatus Carbonibacillus altaicus TaxID=2163959 RepID=A0A2R6Y1P2_9BACL|nr:DUF2768 family protein [Candidatus Carbobacillus altaicus]PTQ56597.1 MAG: hypothetical protein BSOLF_2865 [Candidatus Carbobacillus altaicus]
MLDAVIAIFLLFLANLLITIARTKFKGVPRRLLSVSAFLLLIPAFLFAFRALF